MFGSRIGLSSGQKHSVKHQRGRPSRILLALLFAPALLFISTGCAQKQPAPVATLKPHDGRLNDPKAAVRVYAEVELEDDGREAQQPPLLREHQGMDDDPSQPFSPNYGRSSPLPKTAQSTDETLPIDQNAVTVLRSTDVSFQPALLR